MERRSLLGGGVFLTATAALAPSNAVWAASHRGIRLSAADIAAARQLFAAGAYDRLEQMLPLLLARAQRGMEAGSVGAALAARVWMLASQLAVKQGRTGDAGAHAERAGTAAYRTGDPVVLAAAARAAATPLRRTGRTQQAMYLLEQAHSHLTAESRPSAAALDAAGTVALTAAYTAAQDHQPHAARDLAARAEQTARRLTHAHAEAGRRPELSAPQCALYRIGIHRELGDTDTALAYAAALDPAALPNPERRARAATDTARALLDTGDAAGALTQLRLVELAAPLEARRPSVRAPDRPDRRRPARTTGPGRLRPPNRRTKATPLTVRVPLPGRGSFGLSRPWSLCGR
ncbi:transcriptional regulator [Streptomyces sp. NK08204]|uniref:transcriptional regulator n=1 Tax=Streptomyces sp. NK08204 TaxID=2873260 RepID=UPI001CECBA01|nr:transcriptional regulator [Streptomyces sp. NK08204]